MSVLVPIDQASRAVVDAETDRLRHAVIPIIRDEGGRPFLVGSAVAIRWRGRPCLATAFHVLTGNAGRALGIFGADGLSRNFGGSFQVSEDHDLAVLALEEADAAALAHILFLGEEDIGTVADSEGRFYASVAGYPHTASKLVGRDMIDTRMEAYSAMASEMPEGRISVDFDKKRCAWGGEGHQVARDPIGKSGGAIFGMPLLGLNSVRPNKRMVLVGIPTLWRGKTILGASMMALIPLLDAVTLNPWGDDAV
jgi:hypothetical protein